jgi:hypothetical protein
LAKDRKTFEINGKPELYIFAVRGTATLFDRHMFYLEVFNGEPELGIS